MLKRCFATFTITIALSACEVVGLEEGKLQIENHMNYEIEVSYRRYQSKEWHYLGRLFPYTQLEPIVIDPGLYEVRAVVNHTHTYIVKVEVHKNEIQIVRWGG